MKVLLIVVLIFIVGITAQEEILYGKLFTELMSKTMSDKEMLSMLKRSSKQSMSDIMKGIVEFFNNITKDMNIHEDEYEQKYEFRFQNDNKPTLKILSLDIMKHNNRYYTIDQLLFDVKHEEANIIDPQIDQDIPIEDEPVDDLNTDMNDLRKLIDYLSKNKTHEDVCKFYKEIIDEYTKYKTENTAISERSFEYSINTNDDIKTVKYTRSYNNDNTEYFITKMKTFNSCKN